MEVTQSPDSSLMTSVSVAAGDFCQTRCEIPTTILIADGGVFTPFAVARSACVCACALVNAQENVFVCGMHAFKYMHLCALR